MEVLASRNSSRPTGKQERVPCHLALQALYASESAVSDLLEDDELLLSPILILTSSTRLNELLELRIPHSANVVLTCQKWTVILKETLNSAKWVSVAETGKKDGQGIKNFVTKSNHVRFDTDHLSTFAIVGKYRKSSLSVFKRMKVATFASDAKVGEDLLLRVYCFDDCEWSLEVRLFSFASHDFVRFCINEATAEGGICDFAFTERYNIGRAQCCHQRFPSFIITFRLFAP